MSKKTDMPTFCAREWNASGAIHSYGKVDLRTFVVEVLTTEDIDANLLQAALDKSLERMPYYRQTFVRKKGLYYYADNDLPFVVAESEQPRPVGGATTNYHMVDVTYWHNRIDFSMNHAFCDGLGLNRLIEATLYHYFCLKDNKTYDADGIITDAIPYDPAETADPFATKSNVDPNELKKLTQGPTRFRLPELGKQGSQGPTMYRLPLKVKTADLLGWCKACGTSPAAAVSTFVAIAIENEHDLTDEAIMCVLPISLRRFLHFDKTFKNTSSAVFLPILGTEARDMSVTDLAVKVRADMKRQMSEEMALLLSSSINMVTHLGKKLPTFLLKTKTFSLPQTKPQDTLFIDYVGGLKTNGYGDQISEVRYLNADPCGGSAFILMSETADYFHISFSQTFGSSRYYKAFCRVLDEVGIAYEEQPASTYLNPIAEFPAEQK